MTNGGNKLRKLYWMKIWQVNSNVKIHSLSPSQVWKLSSFFFTVKSSLYSQLNWRTWPQSWGKTLCGFDAAFLPNVFRVVEKLCARNYWTWYKLLWLKYRERKLKSTKKRNFLALKDIFLTSPGCCPTLATSLDVVLVRFASWSVYRVGNDLILISKLAVSVLSQK